jgi:hypothetical protein
LVLVNQSAEEVVAAESRRVALVVAWLLILWRLFMI